MIGNLFDTCTIFVAATDNYLQYWLIKVSELKRSVNCYQPPQVFLWTYNRWPTLLLHHSVIQFQQNKWPQGVAVLSRSLSKQSAHFNPGVEEALVGTVCLSGAARRSSDLPDFICCWEHGANKQVCSTPHVGFCYLPVRFCHVYMTTIWAVALMRLNLPHPRDHDAGTCRNHML